MEKMKRGLRIFRGKTNLEKVLFSFLFLLFVIYSVMLIYPILWGLMSSLKTTDAYFENTFAFPEWPFQFSNYSDALDEITAGGMSFWGMVWNSTWFAGGSALITMEFTSIYAYVLNKYKFRGRNFLYGICIFMMSVPIGATFVSQYRLMYALHITNSYLILITAMNVYGMNLVLFHSFYSNVSWSYAEAAQMDGANFYQIYFKAMRPQAVPMMFTLGLLVFIGKWNDYMAPLLYLPKMPTLATGLFRYQTIVERNGEYPILFAGLIMCLIPIMVLFGLFSEKLMSNISIGGLKG